MTRRGEFVAGVVIFAIILFAIAGANALVEALVPIHAANAPVQTFKTFGTGVNK